MLKGQNLSVQKPLAGGDSDIYFFILTILESSHGPDPAHGPQVDDHC